MRAWRWRAFVIASLIGCTVYDDATPPADGGTDGDGRDGGAAADADTDAAAPDAFAPDADAEAGALFPRSDCEPSPWDSGSPEVACDGLPTNALCGRERICSPTGECVSNVFTFSLSCLKPPLSLAQLCLIQDAGFTGAYAAQGYFWYQCATPFDCPTPWTTANLKCSFCGSSDCGGVPYCGGTTTFDGGPLARCFADETEPVDVNELGGCNGGNPGWLLRTRCRF